MYCLSFMAIDSLYSLKYLFVSSLSMEVFSFLSSSPPCCFLVFQTGPLELHSSRAGLKLGRLGLWSHMGKTLFQMPHTHNIWLLFLFLHSCLWPTGKHQECHMELCQLVLLPRNTVPIPCFMQSPVPISHHLQDVFGALKTCRNLYTLLNSA